MKKIYGLFVMLFAFSMSYGQVMEAEKSMSEGSHTAFSIQIPNTNKKDIEKSWEKFVKKYKGKTGKIKKTEESLSDDAKVTSMSANTVDIYSQVNQEGEDTQLNVWYDLGGTYLSSKSHPEKVTVANAMLDAFMLTVNVAAVEETLKTEEKTLKGLNSDAKGLEKDKGKLEDDIKKAEKTIEDSKKAIAENEAAQKAKQEEIKAQEGVVNQVKTQLKEMN